MERKNITIQDQHADWITNKDINLSRFVQDKINDEIGANTWDTNTFIHEPGVTLGTHTETTERVVHNRFTSPTGYNFLIAGNIGTGKTHGAAYHLAQQQHFNNNILYIDTIENDEINTRLDATTTRITDTTGLNPLQITPAHTTPTQPERLKTQTLHAFIQALATNTTTQTTNLAFGTQHDTQNPDQFYTTVITQALHQTYEKVGIDLSHPETFDNPNPTIHDHFIPTLQEFAETDSGQKSVVADALLTILDPVKKGNKLEQFGGESTLSLTPDSPSHIVLGHHLKPQDTPLLLTVLFNETYQWAKQSNKNTIIAVDDAHNLLQTREQRDAAELMLRHARHHNTSIQLFVQTLDPLIKHNPTLTDLLDHKLLYKLGTLDEQDKTLLGLTEAQAEYVRNATPGTSQVGHSEAVFTTPDRGWVPLRIRTD